MQNGTTGGQKEPCGCSIDNSDKLRFEEAFRELRAELCNREVEPERASLSGFEVFRPQLRIEQPPINIVIHEREREPTYERSPRLIPRSVMMAGKVALFFAVLAGVYYGPSYYSCRQMKERGLFYFGTTVESCVKERLAQRSNPFEAIQKGILPAL